MAIGIFISNMPIPGAFTVEASLSMSCYLQTPGTISLIFSKLIILMAGEKFFQINILIGMI